MQQTRLIKEKTARTWFILIVIVPMFTLHLFINLINRLFSVSLSLFEWNGYMRSGIFVGLDNLRRLVNDSLVWKALYNNLFLAIGSLVITTIVALFLAYVVTRTSFKENKWYQVIFFFPNTLSMVIISMIWLFFFNPSFGPASALLRALGQTPPIWLGDVNWVKPSIILPQVWASVGFYFLIYMAAIKNIPKSLYEAAEIDGATHGQQFFRITLPLIWNIVVTTLVFNFVTSFNGGFTLVKIMTNGGPNGASEVLSTYMFKVGIEQLDYGYGAAIGLLSVILSIVFYVLLTKVVRAHAYEY